MSSDKDPLTVEEGGRRPAHPYWIGAGVFAIGAIWLHGGLSLPVGARYAAVGPGLMPTLVGAGLMMLGPILTLQIWRGEVFEAQDSEDASSDTPVDRRAFLVALCAVVLPVLAMDTLGLPLTAALSFTLVAWALGSRRVAMNLVIGAIVGTLAWTLFTRLGLQLGGALPFLGI